MGTIVPWRRIFVSIVDMKEYVESTMINVEFWIFVKYCRRKRRSSGARKALFGKQRSDLTKVGPWTPKCLGLQQKGLICGRFTNNVECRWNIMVDVWFV